MAKKQKYYVVWRGHAPGIYASWEECLAQITGYSGASHKAFDTRELAEEAFRSTRADFLERHPELAEPREGRVQPRLPIAGEFIADSYAVDAACSGNPGPLEYRCVHVASGREIFKQGPFENGTNNIGEFLAIVHALALFKKRGVLAPIYSDSENAIGWVRRKKCRTKLARDERNEVLFDLVDRAEAWLADNEYPNQVLKWETDAWGESPADFGRKG
ncbi:MAG: viroplasmin family protein [Nitrososphaerales archaeon]